MNPAQKLLVRLIYAASKLPLTFHYFQSHILAFVIGKVVRYRTSLVFENIALAFPDKSSAWVKKVRRDFYLHFAQIIHEAIWFGGCRDGRQALKRIAEGKEAGEGRLRRSRIVYIKNPEVLARLWEETPSVMMMSSHSGNWEILGGIPLYNYSSIDDHLTERNIVVAHRKQNGDFWNSFLRNNRLAPLENPDGNKGYLESRQVLRYMLDHRKEKLFYNFITDQRPYFNPQDQMHIEFLGRECLTMTASASVANRFGMSVVYQHMRMNEKGHGYVLEYEIICEDASKMDPVEITKRYYKLLEEDIKAQPANYLWTHNRWWMP